jgi:hypothetical protein
MGYDRAGWVISSEPVDGWGEKVAPIIDRTKIPSRRLDVARKHSPEGMFLAVTVAAFLTMGILDAVLLVCSARRKAP